MKWLWLILLPCLASAQVDKIKFYDGEMKSRIKDRNPEVSVSSEDFTITAWGETSLKIKLTRKDKDKIKITDKAITEYNSKPKIRLNTEDGVHEFYAIDSTTLEWSITYDKKPGTNIFAYPIETVGLEFCYQPFEVDQPWVETDSGWVGEYRPDDVKGSYAVYHKTKSNNYIRKDGTVEKYYNGKAFHVYRPKIIAADSSWVWGDLYIDAVAGLLTITVPQDFLDKAKYPIIIDPTFGYDGIGGTDISISNSYCAANVDATQIHTASAGDKIISYHWYGKQYSSWRSIGVAVYSMPGGTIDGGSRLAVEAVITVTALTFQWTSTGVDQDMAAGITYAVAMGHPSGTMVGKYDAAGTDSRHTAYFLPATWVQASTQARRYSVYATYTVAGGEAAGQVIIVQ